MKNIKMKAIYLIIPSFILSSCSTTPFTSSAAPTDTTTQSVQLTEVTSNTPVGGGAERSMDQIDRTKLSRALDGGIGKATTWKNAMTGTTYTVVPIEKLTVNGNPFCRKYTVTTENNGNTKEISGTACVSTDGAWHPV